VHLRTPQWFQKHVLSNHIIANHVAVVTIFLPKTVDTYHHFFTLAVYTWLPPIFFTLLPSHFIQFTLSRNNSENDIPNYEGANFIEVELKHTMLTQPQRSRKRTLLLSPLFRLLSYFTSRGRSSCLTESHAYFVLVAGMGLMLAGQMIPPDAVEPVSRDIHSWALCPPHALNSHLSHLLCPEFQNCKTRRCFDCMGRGPSFWKLLTVTSERRLQHALRIAPLLNFLGILGFKRSHKRYVEHLYLLRSTCGIVGWQQPHDSFVQSSWHHYFW
jgi:hypothetical protein